MALCSYGAKTTPHTYLIDPQGTLVYQGAIDSIRGGKTADIDRAENYLNKAIPLIPIPPIPIKKTLPILVSNIFIL